MARKRYVKNEKGYEKSFKADWKAVKGSIRKVKIKKTASASLTKLLEKNLGPISFGGFLKAARTTKDMTQADMAKFLKISKSTLCDIEKGRQLASIDLASKIAKLCKLSVPLAVEATVRDHLKRSKLMFEVQISEVA